MLIDMPEFMKNEEWYYFDEKEGKYIIKKDAPQDAQKSYKEYYEKLERIR